ncbi:hypothetical protein GGF40_003049 [Coemansia sp. RSA 1286]|nr:hypothetical protein GGF40_003049 [Coemansia sp. RSA 1286]
MAQTASCPYGDKCDFIHSVDQNSSRTSTSTHSIDDCSANDNAHLLAKNADYRQQLENLVCALGPARIEQILHKAGSQTPFPLSTPSSPDTPSQSLPLTPAQGMQHSQIPDNYAGIVPQEPFMSNRNDSYPGPFHSHSWDTNKYGQLPPQSCFPPYSPLHKFAVGKHVSAFSPLPAPPQHHLEEPVHLLGPSSAYRHLDCFGSLDGPFCSPQSAIHSQDTLAERLAKLDLTKFNKFY